MALFDFDIFIKIVGVDVIFQMTLSLHQNGTYNLRCGWTSGLGLCFLCLDYLCSLWAIFGHPNIKIRSWAIMTIVEIDRFQMSLVLSKKTTPTTLDIF